MRALVQRVSEAAVLVDGQILGKIGYGMVVFVGIRHDDTVEQVDHLVEKVLHLRIFPDLQGKMNLNVLDTSGGLLIVSQFTLYGDTKKGNRPSYSQAAKADLARPLYEYFVERCRAKAVNVAEGAFQAHMQVRLINDGPVTLMCYSESD